ncbi:MAG TPA: hypothetical protein VKJ01_05725, partial [Candidatus Solibacter sp.]|nr:hypothetical protein [Candidatus Solibacter sp.]
MIRLALFALLAAAGVSGQSGAPAQPSSQPSAQPSSQPASQPEATAADAMIGRYCVGCHNDKLKTAGVSLTGVQTAD